LTSMRAGPGGQEEAGHAATRPGPSDARRARRLMRRGPVQVSTGAPTASWSHRQVTPRDKSSSLVSPSRSPDAQAASQVNRPRRAPPPRSHAERRAITRAIQSLPPLVSIRAMEAQAQDRAEEGEAAARQHAAAAAVGEGYSARNFPRF